jgi:hypothetical protein
MLITEPKIDAVFREYAELQLRRHELLVAAKDDTREITQSEDRMDELWEQLDADQRQSLNGMASDLNWLRRNGEPPPNGRKLPEEVSEAERQALITALASKEWHHVLQLLRICAPTFTLANLALLRGKAYSALALLAYGNAFYAQAADFAAAHAFLEAAVSGYRIEATR